MTDNCTNFLENSYYNSINEQNSAPPYPVFWATAAAPLCPLDDNLRWPQSYAEINSNIIDGLPFNLGEETGNPGTFGAVMSNFYVPLNLIVQIRSTGNPTFDTYEGPMIFTPDTTGIASDYTNAEIKIQEKKIWPLYINDMCLGTTLSIAGKPLTIYSTSNADGYTNCDLIMEAFCSKSTNSANPACACFTDERFLALDYPGLNPPVVCFGPSCAHQGYRTQTMIKNECSIAVCEQFVETNGTNIAITGKTSIYCNQDIYDLPSFTPGPSAAPSPSPGPGSVTTIPSFVWVLVGFAVLLLVAALGAVFWKRK
jgi:hypothetical protein